MSVDQFTGECSERRVIFSAIIQSLISIEMRL
ncbi:hypothetical protein T4A_12699 [Trichinella pseudospiralis]|uniref:Uncharacterized protein n=1 Tax=Trichinella pseudospiralis TaxID=6337 RepID=A0A0V1DQC5_TRIPS|nr:hypothetical protein T4A_12699 [Trichinella pseudospiralis]